jgi:hypothetical protein
MLDDESAHSEEFAAPPSIDHSIRTIVCTSDSRDDLAWRVQQAIGEHSAASDELHVSHSVAPDPRGDRLFYSALIVLRPGTRED